MYEAKWWWCSFIPIFGVWMYSVQSLASLAPTRVHSEFGRLSSQAKQTSISPPPPSPPAYTVDGHFGGDEYNFKLKSWKQQQRNSIHIVHSLACWTCAQHNGRINLFKYLVLPYTHGLSRVLSAIIHTYSHMRTFWHSKLFLYLVPSHCPKILAQQTSKHRLFICSFVNTLDQIIERIFFCHIIHWKPQKLN